MDRKGKLTQFQEEWRKEAMTQHTLSIKGINLKHECYNNKKEDIIIIRGKLLGISNFPGTEDKDENIRGK